ncbi:tyrosine-type recombinase/integrase [Isoptericola sp. NEAU-Y5]|uniref:Tyrosine-type recombinase/integrase n=1 Tax=Isoptericola luteus TaxID=2879484 RepID=A0ABS7ZK21_9MICO|nr:tyrosine-type recombinase/integrase [Isoptericola sp. NEAU-Y5]MCA5894726.1 tyrosine-type recombinase/integrase [Isoptericola sp. NEAU-Y5]
MTLDLVTTASNALSRTADGSGALEAMQARWLGGLSGSTRRAYGADVRDWLRWCAEHGVDTLRPTGRDLSQYLDGLEVSTATKARRMAGVRSFYAWARDEEITTADPMPPRASRPRVRGSDARRILGLTAPEASALMGAADAHGPRSAALVSLLLTTGLRISEALSVTVGDLTHDRGGRTLVTVCGKGNKTRTVVVPPLAVERCHAAADGRGDDEPVFVTRTGRPWSQREARYQMARLGRAAGLGDVHPHQLRHTAATLALTDGTNIEVVRDMLGHSSLATTQRYVAAAASVDRSPAYRLAEKIAPA